MKRAIIFFILLSTSALCFAKLDYQVDIQGVNTELKKTLLGALSLTESNLDIDDEEQLLWYANFGIEELQVALKTLGYYHAKISLKPTTTKKKKNYRYDIELGKPVFIHSISLELVGAGNTDERLKSDLATLPLQPTEPFSDSHYEKGKAQILQTVKNHGYAKAAYEVSQVLIYPEKNEAHINWQLSTGEKHYFGQTIFDDNPLSDELLSRYLPYYFGWPYTNKQLQTLQSDLLQSQYFQNVIAEATLSDDSLEVPVTVHLTPNPPNHYEAGIGYGTDTGPRAKASWLRRYVNRYGHQLNVSGNVSKISNEIETTYKIPGKYPIQDWYLLRLLHTNEEYAFGHSSTLRASGEQVKVLGQWSREAKISTLYEDYREKEGDTQTQTGLIIPSIAYQTTHRDDRFNPTKGYRFKWLLQGAWTTENHLFAQTTISHKQLWQPYKRGLITGKVDIGFTTPNHTDDLPLSLRFYAGGTNSVRGYVYRSLGPKALDNTGNPSVVGGSYFLTTNLGYEHFFTEKLAFGPFWDMGNAMDNWHTGLKSGVGFGLRYKTLIGPLRVDLAKPINRAHGDIRLHLNIGPEL